VAPAEEVTPARMARHFAAVEAFSSSTVRGGGGVSLVNFM